MGQTTNHVLPFLRLQSRGPERYSLGAQSRWWSPARTQVSPQHTDSIVPPASGSPNNCRSQRPLLGQGWMFHIGALLRVSSGLVCRAGHILSVPLPHSGLQSILDPSVVAATRLGPSVFSHQPDGGLTCRSLSFLPVLVLCETPQRYMGKESRPNQQQVSGKAGRSPGPPLSAQGSPSSFQGHWAQVRV